MKKLSCVHSRYPDYERSPSSIKRSYVLPALLAIVLLLTAAPVRSDAQELGFLNVVFNRVQRISLSVLALDPKETPNVDRSGSGCITLALCGAGVTVLIDLDTRADNMELELGLGAGYLRILRGYSGDSLDIRGALRSLPVVSTQATWLASRYFHPYFLASFGLVDLWNGRATNTDARQTEVKASTFEYGISLGLAVRPARTNGRMQIEGGYRARTFSSIGYGYDQPLNDRWPRQLDLSGWQIAAGWQFDLRPIAKSPDFSGSYVLSRVDGAPFPTLLSQVRTDTGNVRLELMNAWLDVSRRPGTFRLVLITRSSLLNSDGVAQQVLYPEPTERRGHWEATRVGHVSFTLESDEGVEATASGERIEDELVILDPITGRRLHFRRIRGT